MQNLHSNRRLIPFEEKDIVSISISSPIDDRILLLERDEMSNWFCKTYPDLALNQTGLANMCNRVLELNHSEPLKQASINDETFGLIHPSKQIKVYTEKEIIDIQIGNTNPTTGSSYVRINDATSVFSVDSTFINLFTSNIFELMQRKSIFEISEDQISSFSILSAAGYLSFNRSQMDNGKESWTVKSDDVLLPSVDALAVEATLSSILNLYYEEMIVYHPTAVDLDSFGLSTPLATITVNSKNGEAFTLDINPSPEKESSNYVYSSHGVGIETVSDHQLNDLLRLSSVQYQSLAIISAKPADLGSLIVTHQGKNYTFQHLLSGSNDEWSLNGKPIDSKSFNSFYFPLYALTADKAVSELSNQDSKDVILTLEYLVHDINSSPLVVSFISYDATYLCVSINGLTNMLIKKEKVDSIISSFHSLINS